MIEVIVANNIRGEAAVILGDGSLVTNVIKPSRAGFFKCLYYSDVPANAKTYSLVVEYQTVTPYLRGDIDNDGDVDFEDFFILADNFGKTSVVADGSVDSLLTVGGMQ